MYNYKRWIHFCIETIMATDLEYHVAFKYL